MSNTNHQHPFTRYLIDKVSSDRAARAALRRSLGRAPGEAPEAFRYVVPWLPADCSERSEAIYYLVAGLFSLYPEQAGGGNMGDHLRKLAGDDEKSKARLERRLETALRAHPNDLPDQVRRLVGLLMAKKVPINWHQLMWDLLTWERDDQRPKKAWANAFWGTRTKQDQTDDPAHTLSESETTTDNDKE